VNLAENERAHMESWMSRTEADAFAKRLRDRRKASGMSQSQFAKKMQISTNTASYWENARTQPMPDRIANIAEVLGTTEQFLRTGVQDNGADQSKKDSSEDFAIIVEEFRQKAALIKGVQPNQVEIRIVY
jgi:transcriptional regulator with XRE-family HTH domain